MKKKYRILAIRTLKNELDVLEITNTGSKYYYKDNIIFDGILSWTNDKKFYDEHNHIEILTEDNPFFIEEN